MNLRHFSIVNGLKIKLPVKITSISTEIGSRLHQLFDFLNLEERLDEARGPFRVRITFRVRTIEGIRFPRCTHTANNGGQWQRAGGLEMRDRYERRDRKIGKNYKSGCSGKIWDDRWETRSAVHIYVLNKNHRPKTHSLLSTYYILTYFNLLIVSHIYVFTDKEQSKSNIYFFNYFSLVLYYLCSHNIWQYVLRIYVYKRDNKINNICMIIILSTIKFMNIFDNY